MICRKPNSGPKVEKKHTGMTPSRLMKKMVRSASTKPSLKTGTARAPSAKVAIPILTASHWTRLTSAGQFAGVETLPWWLSSMYFCRFAALLALVQCPVVRRHIGPRSSALYHTRCRSSRGSLRVLQQIPRIRCCSHAFRQQHTRCRRHLSRNPSL